MEENKNNAELNESVVEAPAKKGMTFKDFILEYNAIIVLVLVIIISIILSPVFFTWTNFCNLMRQYAPYFLLVCGMLMIMISGGIDLSLGAMIAVGGIVFSVTLKNWGWGSESAWGLIPCLLFVALVGVLFGCINASLVNFGGMPPFVATLATQMVANGVANTIVGGAAVDVSSTGAAFNAMRSYCTGSTLLIKLPWLGLTFILLGVIVTIVIKLTVFGRMITASGSNGDAVKFAGLNLIKYRFIPYLFGGMFSTLAGAILVGRATIASPTAGSDYQMDAIAACVIGGSNLFGGTGSVPKSYIGMCILALIGNIMNLLSIGSYMQNVCKGLIIMGAVLLMNATDKISE